MENNKNNLDNKQGNNPVDEAKKEQERIKKLQDEVQISREVFGASCSDDINKNLGLFPNKEPVNNDTPNANVVKAQPAVSLDVAPNTNVREQDKINFQKFENTSRYKSKKNYSKFAFLETFAVWLRTKKGFILTLSLEIAFLILIVAISSVLIAATKSIVFGFIGDGPLNSLALRNLSHTGYVFSIIALCPLAIPIIYLITAWFIGIKQVMTSRNFHLIVIFITFICFICLIISIICCSIPLVDNANFVH